MSGVYGTFIENFPELFDTFNIWYEGEEDIKYTVRAIYMPDKGDGIKRRKYTSGNTGLDIIEDDVFYISHKFNNTTKIGAYVQKLNDNIIMRLTKVVRYDKAAGYYVYTIEKVTGTTLDKDKKLDVKEATFA